LTALPDTGKFLGHPKNVVSVGIFSYKPSVSNHGYAKEYETANRIALVYIVYMYI
jgi:hypothetical protein